MLKMPGDISSEKFHKKMSDHPKLILGMGKKRVWARERGSDNTLLQMCLHSWLPILGKQGGPIMHTWQHQNMQA